MSLGGWRCNNIAEHYAKGHQDKWGSIIGIGDFLTYRNRDSFQKFIVRTRDHSLRIIEDIENDATDFKTSIVRQHLNILESKPNLQPNSFQVNKCYLCGGKRLGDGVSMDILLKPVEAGPRVLAVDGGGVRGMASIRMLQLLEDEIGVKCSDDSGDNLPILHVFDLLLGTSLGGIITLGLGVKSWSARTGTDKFKTFAKDAFY
ncbi:uncharacterized protein A1O9_06331 [Exophiala aquamarina CBS 119918]|uniref:PNPLA domain-containing protein n=1 Tax=Exophiala aquamarina CBS 119918 TaxID=1182545 RepID=A0A072PSB6_9EURO|nr:uncharacterized protein A1O9_06331 [Exophiala aquamarina CBS 119918]KEF58405.1 hypothetical protein A1O9_06331 [Exophiala aquamarina CBS 119918]